MEHEPVAQYLTAFENNKRLLIISACRRSETVRELGLSSARRPDTVHGHHNAMNSNHNRTSTTIMSSDNVHLKQQHASCDRWQDLGGEEQRRPTCSSTSGKRELALKLPRWLPHRREEYPKTRRVCFYICIFLSIKC